MPNKLKAPAESKTTTRVRKKKVQTLSLEERYPNVRPEAEYVSASGQEYLIVPKRTGFWVIERYKGGRIPAGLDGLYQTKQLAERSLIKHLRDTDTGNRAYWPDKPNARTDLPYGPKQREQNLS